MLQYRHGQRDLRRSQHPPHVRGTFVFLVSASSRQRQAFSPDPAQIVSPGGSIHTADYAAAVRTQDAHDRTLRCGRAMASTALQVLADDDFAAAVRREFDAQDWSIAADPAVA